MLLAVASIPRTLTIAGEPWFVARDVCDALGIANLGNAIVRLDDDEKSSIRNPDGTPGNPNMTVVNEPGLYSVAPVLGSNSPDAEHDSTSSSSVGHVLISSSMALAPSRCAIPSSEDLRAVGAGFLQPKLLAVIAYQVGNSLMA
jgi:hypothetical protein